MIYLTTSRDPSQRTRRFARAISSFMDWKYIQRGKRSMDEILKEYSRIIILREIKGNPSFMDVFEDGRKILTLRINVGIIRRERMEKSPVYFAGKAPFDPLILGALPKSKAGEKFARKSQPKKIVYVRGGKRLEFIYDGERVITLKILGVYEG